MNQTQPPILQCPERTANRFSDKERDGGSEGPGNPGEGVGKGTDLPLSQFQNVLSVRGGTKSGTERPDQQFTLQWGHLREPVALTSGPTVAGGGEMSPPSQRSRRRKVSGPLSDDVGGETTTRCDRNGRSEVTPLGERGRPENVERAKGWSSRPSRFLTWVTTDGGRRVLRRKGCTVAGGRTGENSPRDPELSPSCTSDRLTGGEGATPGTPRAQGRTRTIRRLMVTPLPKY